MAKSEFAKLDSTEIRTRLRELKSELFNLRFQQASGKLENYRRLRQIRKEIARALTALTSKAGGEA
ncbi:MAG: 50S ribosomal protein L29 [bacterium]|jgi:large subunit ribosomal protein L29